MHGATTKIKENRFFVFSIYLFVCVSELGCHMLDACSMGQNKE
jgi:hypothetical protein